MANFRMNIREHRRTCLGIPLGALAFFLLTACGSVQIFDLPKVQKELNETLQKSQSIAQKSQADFTDKKTLIENLSRSGSSAFKENENELRRHLKAMDESLQEIVVQKKNMSEASGEIASMSYGRERVRSDEREYPRVEDAVKRFESAAEDLNSSVLDYSRESNSMADLIAAKKLYFTFDVAEFQKRVQKTIAAAQENQAAMQKELTRSQNILDGNKTDTRGSQERSLDEMRTLANDYTDRASQLSNLSRDVHGLTLGSAKTSTLDEQWPKVSKLVSDFDRLAGELASMNESFNRKREDFRHPQKRSR